MNTPSVETNVIRNDRLDGLRGVAIALVLLQHLVANAARGAHGVFGALVRFGDLGWTGVDLFFVLSGFFICGIVVDHLESPSFLRTFYRRRACRILPLYTVLLISFLVVRWLTKGSPFAWMVADNVPFWSYLVFLQNYWMAHSNSFGGGWLGVTWSLAVEEQFYLTLPFLALLVRRKALPWFLLALFLAAPVARVWAAQNTFVRPMVLLPWCGDGLAAGALLAMVVREPRLVDLARRFGGMLLMSAAILGTVWTRNSGFASHGPLASPIAVLFFANLVLLAFLNAGGPVFRVLETAPLVWIGRRSYGIYLLHYPIWLVVYGVTGSAYPVLLGITLLVTFAFAEVSWEYFEKPLIAVGHRFLYEELPSKALS